MESGDASALRIWSALRRLSLQELNKIYSRLDVEFDVVEGESRYGLDAADFKKKLQTRGWLKESTKEGMEGQVHALISVVSCQFSTSFPLLSLPRLS